MRKQDIRRFAAVGLCLMLLSGCNKSPEASGDRNGGSKESISLYDRGLELITRMDLMAESQEYVKMMTTSPEVLEVVKEIGDGDYSEPKAVYEVKISEAAIKSLFDLYGGQMDSLPEELKEGLKHRMVSSVPTMISAMEGTDVLAAVSLIVADEYFIDNRVTEDTIYFYVYDSRCCGAVVFSVYDEGIVAASGRMIVSEIFSQAESEETVKDWIVENAGLLGAEVLEVSP